MGKRRKKVGIVSIFRTGNYGGTLQAYALMKAINDNGYGDAEIINYCCDAIKGKIDFRYLKKTGVVRTTAAIIDKIIYLPRMKKVNKFINSYVSGEEMKKEHLTALNNKYDIFLTGSDQLWNPDIQQGDYYYLLDFITENDKKRSYASSFGKKILPEQYKEKYKQLLSEYEVITVREKAGEEIVYDLLGTRPKVVLDPTLLLTSKQWKQILPKKIRSENYIFTYRLTYSDLLTHVVKKVQKKLDEPVMAAPFLLGYCPRSKSYLALSSLEWVRGIYDSNYVVTDSFHGVVFAIIFSKQFYYVVTTSTVKERLSRLETLLENLGIKNRVIESVEECEFKNQIDYVGVQERLSCLRSQSLEILKEILS